MVRKNGLDIPAGISGMQKEPSKQKNIEEMVRLRQAYKSSDAEIDNVIHAIHFANTNKDYFDNLIEKELNPVINEIANCSDPMKYIELMKKQDDIIQKIYKDLGDVITIAGIDKNTSLNKAKNPIKLDKQKNIEELNRLRQRNKANSEKIDNIIRAMDLAIEAIDNGSLDNDQRKHVANINKKHFDYLIEKELNPIVNEITNCFDPVEYIKLMKKQNNIIQKMRRTFKNMTEIIGIDNGKALLEKARSQKEQRDAKTNIDTVTDEPEPNKEKIENDNIENPDPDATEEVVKDDETQQEKEGRLKMALNKARTIFSKKKYDYNNALAYVQKKLGLKSQDQANLDMQTIKDNYYDALKQYQKEKLGNIKELSSTEQEVLAKDTFKFNVDEAGKLFDGYTQAQAQKFEDNSLMKKVSNVGKWFTKSKVGKSVLKGSVALGVISGGVRVALGQMPKVATKIGASETVIAGFKKIALASKFLVPIGAGVAVGTLVEKWQKRRYELNEIQERKSFEKMTTNEQIMQLMNFNQDSFDKLVKTMGKRINRRRISITAGGMTTLATFALTGDASVDGVAETIETTDEINEVSDTGRVEKQNYTQPIIEEKIEESPMQEIVQQDVTDKLLSQNLSGAEILANGNILLTVDNYSSIEGAIIKFLEATNEEFTEGSKGWNPDKYKDVHEWAGKRAHQFTQEFAKANPSIDLDTVQPGTTLELDFSNPANIKMNVDFEGGPRIVPETGKKLKL